ncbi:MAG: tetratricopeptide repeat protein [Actinomycetota bacterium]|nr:tetratricopeptide repeat protein [Actinomycetota bacterium]
MIFDVSEAEFETKVIERSREVPVIVDFWAEWCGPCRQLGPALEDAVRAREGMVELAKVDVDANQMLAQAFRVQGIPAVKAFRDGKIASEFTGALPPDRLGAFVDALLPSEADGLAAGGDEESLRAALAADPDHRDAAVGLSRILIARGENDAARDLLAKHTGDYVAAGLIARLDLSAEPGSDLDGAFVALDQGDTAAALEGLQTAIAREDDPERRDLIRQVMVAVFTELGAGHELATEHRRRLAAALN